ncbi:hypothetical protein IKB17_04700 [bacterium]|nr:hypothetical protein [bacterium]
MQIRTFLRIMVDNLFINNPFCKAVIALVNFCKEQGLIGSSELKILKNMPLKKLEEEKVYQKKFIFKNNHSSGVYYK